MSAYKKRSRRPILKFILCLIIICALVLGAAYAALAAKLKKLAEGASFDFAYTVTSTAAETPALYSVLEQTGATRGSVYGVYSPAKLMLTFRSLTGDTPAAAFDSASGGVVMHPEARSAEPFTHVYIDSSETLYDVGQLYDTMRQSVVASYPLADSLLPTWNIGDYISQTQLAALLGVELKNVEMQDLTAFAPLAPAAFKPAEVENAYEGWWYFELNMPDADSNSPTLVLGLPKSAFFAETTPLHIILTIPNHSARIELLGELNAAAPAITAPESRMSDDDVAVFAQIRQTLEQVASFVKQLAG